MQLQSLRQLIVTFKVFVFKVYSFVCSRIGVIINILPSRFTDSRFHKSKRIKISSSRSILMLDYGPITRMRANTFFSKEPETIDWINSFPPNSTLLDIGANVGCYSLYAAHKGHKVISIEPDPSNFAVLLRNIYLNSFELSVIPVLVTLANDTSFVNFRLNSLSFGGALHTASATEVDGYNFKCFSSTVDNLIHQTKLQPNFLKIDVDGLESQILACSRNLLKSPFLKSILVELEEFSDDEKRIIAQLDMLGFSLISKKHAPQFNDGPYKNIYNYIFDRF